MPALSKPPTPVWEQGTETLALTAPTLQPYFHTGYLPGNEFTLFYRRIVQPTSAVTSATKYVLEIELKKSPCTHMSNIRCRYISKNNLHELNTPTYQPILITYI